MSTLYIGLMSGTSLDGVDAALVDLRPDGTQRTLGCAYVAFPDALRADLMALQAPADNEIEREARAANAIAERYAECVAKVLNEAGVQPGQVRALGAHGQTIRHRPELGFTRQTNNPALLAELTGITVVADFRMRDIAAGGQGAPLVPAFHQALFGKPGATRVLVNIGGIGNISVLHADGRTGGYDTGPGNVLIDLWIARHRGAAYDAGGAWAASGTVLPDLLAALLREPYFSQPAPKSTGRDLFHAEWLDAQLAGFPAAAPADVQATLTALTARSIADGILGQAPQADAVYVCGGGAYNGTLIGMIAAMLRDGGCQASVASTDALGVPPNQVEALAFAWLAQRCVTGQPGNLPAVTGARGPRVLGAIYPA
jgi:anhydro-N-acetylmuramic acid kinase